MDGLSAIFHSLSLRARLVFAGGLCGPWVVDHNSEQAIWFHLVTKGCGWVHSPAWPEPLRLETGDLVLFLPHARKHYLSYSPSDVRPDLPGARTAHWPQGDSGMVCGLIEPGVAPLPVWRTLPAEIVVRQRQAGPILAQLIELITAESGSGRFGSFAVIERLCDGIFLLAVRHCIESGSVRGGVFGAMADARLEKALALIHQEPWRDWTLNGLCAQVGLSKTALIQKFDRHFQLPPMEYLTRWRMQIAADWLSESGMTVEKVASRCGYDSLSSFSRAFKRCLGTSPGRYRRSHSGAEYPLIPIPE
ncbi:AraC family transcriptional regulator [Methylomonas sp. EFPC3]|uniref:AraC family transcriptional regulator n=1 Tax=Methylomonas sp. EFPC3 TaxID=3021710 RepID=UPI002417173F|nr:AraC family transcriptional regulator [Methylomonas sp. EFPC3]WFP49151.1 AraC family transcriptional regulator [Methylomonas sp. EFPC3]